MSEQSGFILLVVLLLLSFIASLLFIDQQQDFLLKHLELNQYRRIQQEQIVEVALQQLSQGLFRQENLPHCLINRKPLSWFSLQTKKWWDSASSCHTKVLNQKINYVVMPLFKTTCITFKGQPVQFVQLVVNNANRYVITRSVVLAILDHHNKLTDCKQRIESINGMQQAWIPIKS